MTQFCHRCFARKFPRRDLCVADPFLSSPGAITWSSASHPCPNAMVAEGRFWQSRTRRDEMKSLARSVTSWGPIQWTKFKLEFWLEIPCPKKKFRKQVI